jgi:hypothetical protein
MIPSDLFLILTMKYLYCYLLKGELSALQTRLTLSREAENLFDWSAQGALTQHHHHPTTAYPLDIQIFPKFGKIPSIQPSERRCHNLELQIWF